MQRRMRPAALARAAVCLIGLAALLAGVPYLLWHWGTLPTHAPTLSQVRAALTQPDDGSLLFTVLTIAAWVAWVWCLVPVLIEIIAVLARRTTPRLPGLAAPQRLAGFLVGGILLIATPATAMAATAPTAAAAPATATAPQRTAPATTPAAAAAHAPTAGPTHTVRHGDTLWDLAERYLGDGMRWKDIADLNPGTQAGALVDGSELRLPADAHSPATATGPDTSNTQAARPDRAAYTVRSGDNLSGIAHDQLHDASAWPAIYNLNKGEALPDGGQFDSPDLIEPGQQLALPAQPAGDGTASHPTSTPTPPPTHSAGGQATTQPVTPSAPATAVPTTPSPTSTPTRATPAPAQQTTPAAPTKPPTPQQTPAPTTHSPTPTTIAPAGTTHPVNRSILVMLGGGLLASSLLTALAARRIWQQRARRPGHRIAMPTGSTAATEHALRATEDPDGTTLIEGALRTAAVYLAQAARPLPHLIAALHGDDGLTLYLADPAPPVAPFTTNDGDLTRWHCPADTSELLGPDHTGDVDAPYPLLLPIGGDGDGRSVLVDLEHFGLIRLTGPRREQVLRTLAIEVATSPFADCLTAHILGPACPGLTELVPERLTTTPDPTAAVHGLAAWHRDQQTALEAVDADSMRHARAGGDNLASWTPHVLLAAHDFTEDHWNDLQEAVTARPRSATALITTSAPHPTLESGWELATDERAVAIPGTDLTCIPLSLADEDYHDIIDSLATTGQPDHLAPARPAEGHPSDGQDEAAWSSDQPSTPVEPQVEPQVEPVGSPLELQLEPAASALEWDWEPTPDEDEPDAPRGLQESAVDDEPAEPGAAMDAGAPERSDTEGGDAGTDALISQLAGLDADSPGQAQLEDTPAPHDEPRHAPSPTSPADISAVIIPAVLPAGLPSPTMAPPPALAAEHPAQPAPARATEPPHNPEPTGPVIRVLGPVEITGARGELDRYQRPSTEIAAWIALHPGRDHHALDEAIWPGKNVSRQSRNSAISRLRAWLGVDEHNHPYLPHVSDTVDARYRLADAVTCDWAVFQRLASHGMRTSGPDGDQALREALEWVRSRPFAGVPPRRYTWAEHWIQEMISTIVDVATELGDRRLQVCDPRGALWAATKGLDAAPEMEQLHRIAFRAHHDLGDHHGLERAVQRLEDLLMELQVDMDEETSDLLHTLA
ncbi:LysM peptidoglycan-binding domain-containing protein [Streptantibioticus ferralitis]|uniref:LysM peptidoglycan-binding domain-containing protein n=1 Tax=Streptantibioticus ferralitis TaxID=236510 RepID=A0ABT5Z792_9ACTN|nr:LysM peptidoglycan-binding domain-containing protein [Streptantibioticus ferralitis]MDF2259706.1 LysM peptidoglycan-binding domain-containing protein [Streptantibioticus ferralitis]